MVFYNLAGSLWCCCDFTLVQDMCASPTDCFRLPTGEAHTYTHKSVQCLLEAKSNPQSELQAAEQVSERTLLSFLTVVTLSTRVSG